MRDKFIRFIAVLAAGTLTVSLGACTNSSADGGDKENASQSQSAEVAQLGVSDSTEADENTGEDGLDSTSLVAPAQWDDSNLKKYYLSGEEKSYRDNFHMAVNRDWVLANDIPEGYYSYDMFTERQMEVDEEIIGILSGSSDADSEEVAHDLSLIQTYYELWLDWDHRDELGISPLRDLMDPLMEVDSLDELTAYLSDENTAGNATELAQFYADCDWNNTDQYTVYVSPMSFIFGDSAYYQGAMSFDVHDEPFYDDEIRYLLVRMGYSDDETDSIIEGCVEFEKMVAEHVMTTEEQNAEDAIYRQNNPMTMEEMRETAGAFPIEEIARAFCAENADSYILTEPEWLKNMDIFYCEENLEIMKDYLLCYTAQDYAALLDREAYEHYTEVLNGINGGSGSHSDEKAAADAVDQFLPMQLGRVYSDRYISDRDVEEVKALIDEVIDEYELILSEVDFLSDATREEALKKLRTMRVKVESPSEWEDDSTLFISGSEEGGSLFRAQEEISAYLLALQEKNIGTAYNHETWDASPQDVNAFYSPLSNSITLCAGILGGGFYSSDMTREQLLATVGNTIGHEITHAFDSSGCHFDENGNVRDWWNTEDYEAFQERAEKVVDYYNAIEPIAGITCSGTLVEAEAIADLGAMKATLRIASREENFDYVEFFETYASTWRTISTDHMEIYLLMQDSHPLAYLRTNVVVQQFDEFYDTYGVKVGDGMYLSPKERLEVW